MARKEQLCGGLAVRAPQKLTSLHLSLCFNKEKDLQRASAALAQLPSLQLSYSSQPALSLMHRATCPASPLSPSTCQHGCAQHIRETTLFLLAVLSSLASLSLAGRFLQPLEALAAWGVEAAMVTAMALPPWPRLRHLDLAGA
jgi:hypothetical protein